MKRIFCVIIAIAGYNNTGGGNNLCGGGCRGCNGGSCNKKEKMSAIIFKNTPP